ncbi:MAG: hypothetical protein AAF974_06065 [Cyanobacteria bacterium P01_E01_bin.34]
MDDVVVNDVSIVEIEVGSVVMEPDRHYPYVNDTYRSRFCTEDFGLLQIELALISNLTLPQSCVF